MFSASADSLHPSRGQDWGASEQGPGFWVFKLKIIKGTKVNHTQWDAGNNKAFIIHVMNALSYCDRKGFFKVYYEAEPAFAEAVSEAKLTKAVVDKLAKDESKEQKAQAQKDNKAANTLVQELK